MRFLGRAFVAIVTLAVIAPRAHSLPTPEAGIYDVKGLHDEEGAYTGTARLELDGLKARMTVACTTQTGKKFGWTGTGKLKATTIALTIDPDTPGAAGVLAGSSAQVQGHAEYVVGDERTLSGYWQFTSGKKNTPRAGGTDTLVRKHGAPAIAPDPNLPPPRLPDDALPVPIVSQPDGFSCGAASLEAVLYYYRVSSGQLHSIYKPLKTSGANGTEPPEIIAFAKSRGLDASYSQGKAVGLEELRDALARRDPVMLVIQAWKETTTPWKDDVDDAHWVVLVALDAHYAYFMDPWAKFGYGYMPLDELMERWHCEDAGPGGKSIVQQHECVFFRGFAPPRPAPLVRMR